MKLRGMVWAVVAALAAFAPPAVALEAPVKARLAVPYTEFAPGKSYPVLLELAIEEGYHVNSEKPLDPALIPTKATFAASDPRVTLGRVTYPQAVLKKFQFAREKLSVYEGTVYIATSVSLAPDAKGIFTLTAHLTYQACTEISCMMPLETDITAQVIAGSEGTPLEPRLFSENVPTGGGDVFAELKGGISLTALVLVFLGGLALNLTPCVYPMIPVTVGFFGAATGRSRGETFRHALVYLLGMALMYSALGVAAALTGSLFGALMQNTFVVLLIVAIMLALAASMFGAYDIAVPKALLDVSGKSYAGYFGTLFMGLTVGILAAPCVGPFVIGLLTFVGGRQDPLLGFVLFFVLALGLGLPLVLLALFSGAIAALPRSGVWMVWVRKVFGVVLVGMAAYFARPLVPSDAAYRYLFAVVGVVGGLYLMYAGRGIGGAAFGVARYGIGIAAVAGGVWIGSASPAAHEGLHFSDYSKDAYQKALDAHRPVVIDFTADWCLPCRELKTFTFADKAVVARAGEFDALVVDLTNVTDEKLAAKNGFGVLGVPTVILINADGKEVDRFTGFIPAEEFLQKLDKLKQ